MPKSSAVPAGKLLSKEKELSVAFFPTIKSAARDWDQAAPAHDVFLQSDYLMAMEETAPERMRFGYLVFYHKQLPVGVALLQIMPFRADKSLNDTPEQKGTDSCFFRTFGRFFKSLVASKVEFSALVCGNLTITGEHGYYFDNQVVAPKKILDILNEGILFAQSELDARGLRTDVIFLKDFFENGDSHSRQLNDQEFYEFCVQPSMIFDLQSEWRSFDDYLEALSSKYRVRAKRAFKKAAGIEKRPLNESQIWAYNDRIYALYEDIADAAGFNTFQLHPDYFLGLKQHLGERFQIHGYFLNGEMVGFFTTILNGDELEAHFIGYDENENHEHQLYLNMLFDMVKIGIEMQVKRVVFARTALEIKSSVGAEPHQLYCYIRHRNTFANRFIKPLVDYLKPEEDWQPRKPFRE